MFNRLIAILGLAGLAVGLLLDAPGARAATSAPHSSPAVEARLIAAEDGVTIGTQSISAALDIKLGEGWKTYWRSPGEVGIPPEITWSGSQNLAEAEILWPAPKRFRAFGIENFGYEKEVALPLRITLERSGEPVSLRAAVNLLVCSDICVPEIFELSLELPRGDGIDDQSAAQIAKFAAKVPDDGTGSEIDVTAAYISEDSTALVLAARSESGFAAPDVFPELGPEVAFGAPDIRLGDGGRTLWGNVPILYAGSTLPELRVTITDGARAATQSPALADAAPKPPFTLRAAVPGLGDVLAITIVAFLGGLILNVMPCVLPVLSIKLSSALKSGGQSRARIRSGFLASALGVLTFMWALAAVTLLLRSLGLSVGWGLQFQNPSFLTVMFLILALFAANLFGAFEINLPSSLQTRLARADGAPGHMGDFATGAFAAVLATPCSAPFLGTAVAFALAGRDIDILVIFTALGLGLATPYLLVATRPGLVSRMPKPGPWMVRVKAILGAMLALTAIWLLWVLIGVAGPRTTILVTLGTLVLVTGFSFGRFHGRTGAIVAALVAVTVMIGPGFLSAPAPAAAPAGTTNWVAFDRAEIARLVSTGKTVFVDVTADWCLTCKANKALVLDRDPVATALDTPAVVPMQADWTRPDERISRYLESFGRFGIPFNAVYGPAAPEGIVLSELLSSQEVLEALARASSGSELTRAE